MKTYLDMDEILRHCRRYIGQEYDEPYLVSAVPEEVIRSLPPADVMEVRHGAWIPAQDYSNGNEDIECSSCGEWFKSLELCGRLGEPNYCPVCGSKNKDGGHDE